MSAELLIRLPDYFPSLINAMHDGFVLRGTDGTIIEVNDALCRMIERPRQAIVGTQPPHGWWADEDHARFDSAMARFLSGETAEEELVFQRASGERFPVLVTSAPLRDGEGQVIAYLGTIKDMTERVRAEKRLAVQYAVTRVLADSPTVRDALATIVYLLGEHLGWTFGAWWVLDEPGGALRCEEVWRHEAHGHDTSAMEAANRELRPRRGEGLPGYVWEVGTPVWLDETNWHETFLRVPAAEAAGLRASVAFPLTVGDTTVGVIELFASTQHREDPALTTMLTTLGSQIGQFIDRKRAEAAMRESEDRFRMMADSAPVLLWIAGPDARASWFNKGWHEFTGRTLEQESGDGWTEGIHPDDAGHCRATWLAAYQAHEPFSMEYRLRRHDGEYRWLLDNGVPRFDSDGTFIGFIGSCIEITDRKRVEEDLRFLSEAKSVLASSLDYQTTLASVARMAVGRIADWCAVHVVEGGSTPVQMAVAHHDPDRVAWALEIQQRYPPRWDQPDGLPTVLRTGKPLLVPVVTDAMIVAAARDAEHERLIREIGFTSAMIVPISVRERVLGAITFVSAEQGRHYTAGDLDLALQLASRAGIAIDNARLYREAQEAARARDQFLAVAAHELRSPLTSMKGFAQLLLRRAERIPGGRDWVRPLVTIDAQVNRVTELVNRLLDVSRIEEKRLRLQIEPVDLLDIVVTSVAEAQLATERHLIAIDGPTDPLPVELDRMRIQQVLANLLDNAMKYSPEGGPITVSIQPEEESITIGVRDRGIGIAPEVRDQVFDRFFRATSATREMTEGLGLGLYVAHGIVVAHGGTMWVESTPGEGTTFSVRLPRQAQPVAN